MCLTGKVLGNLQLNLLSKSKVYEDPALSAIFLHNNYNYTLKSLEKYVKTRFHGDDDPHALQLFSNGGGVFRSDLIQLVTVTQKKAENSYRELIEQQIQMYQHR